MYVTIRLVIGDILSKGGYIAILFSVAFFDVLSYLIKWYLEKGEADLEGQVDSLTYSASGHKKKKEGSLLQRLMS